MGTCIYLSEWSPKGVRKNWERVSVDNESAAGAIGQWAQGNIIDACGWFEPAGALRVLVADTDKGKRITMRLTARGTEMRFDPVPA